jgi:DNA-binding response OmpR family regulator
MISRRPPTNTVQASRYVVVDPQTLGRLRTLKLGDVELDLDGYRVIVRGTPAPLPRKEFMVLRQLMENAGQVVTRRALVDNAWGPDRTAQARHYLPVHIRRIRQKIESNADRPSCIRTVRNVGYIFDVPDPINNTRSYIP